MASRKIEDLHPALQPLAKTFLERAKAAGFDLLVTCTFRSMQEQEALYAQGRTAPGKRVTNAKPGDSAHNYGLALDIVPMHGGKPVWNTSGADGELWAKVGRIGQSAGLEWGGAWQSFKDCPHFQMPNWRAMTKS